MKHQHGKWENILRKKLIIRMFCVAKELFRGGNSLMTSFSESNSVNMGPGHLQFNFKQMILTHRKEASMRQSTKIYMKFSLISTTKKKMRRNQEL